MGKISREEFNLLSIGGKAKFASELAEEKAKILATLGFHDSEEQTTRAWEIYCLFKYVRCMEDLIGVHHSAEELMIKEEE